MVQLDLKYQSLLDEEKYNLLLKTIREDINYYLEHDIDGNYYYQLSEILRLWNESFIEIEEDRCRLSKLASDVFSYIDVKAYNKALACAFEYHDYLPYSWYSNYLLGHALVSSKDYTLAYRYLTNALKINPTDPASLFDLAICSEKQGNINNSLKRWNQFQNVNRNTTYDGYLRICNLLLSNKRYKEATKIYEESLKKLNRLSSCELKKYKSSYHNLKKEYFSSKIDESKTEKNQELSYLEQQDIDDLFQFYLFDITNMIITDGTSTINLDDLDHYIYNLQLNNENLSLLKLRTAKLLYENSYTKRAIRYIKEVESSKDKTPIVKDYLSSTKKQLTILKNKQKY